jgi:Tfp pilus assembly protein PilO
MQTPKATNRYILLLTAVFAVVVLGGGALLWVQNSGVQSARRLLEEKEETLVDSRRMARRFEQAQAAWLEDQAALQFLETGVSSAAYVPSLLKQLEDLGRDTRNRVLGVRPTVQSTAPRRIDQRRDPEAQAKGAESPSATGDEPEAKPEPYTLLQINVRLVGTYDSIQDFVYRLTRFPKIIAVEQLQMQPHVQAGVTRTGSEANLLNVEMELTAFIMKEAVVPAAPDVQALALSGATQP